MVYIKGEEMTRYTMDLIIKKWIDPHFDTGGWEYFDLSCKNRDDTEDKCLFDAVAAGARIGAISRVRRSSFDASTAAPRPSPHPIPHLSPLAIPSGPPLTPDAPARWQSRPSRQLQSRRSRRPASAAARSAGVLTRPAWRYRSSWA